MNYIKSFELFENNKIVGNIIPSKVMSQNLPIIDKTIDFVLSMFGEHGNLPLKQFLREICMVETRLGTANGTIRATTGVVTGGRGPWQIDEINFKESKLISRHPQLKKYIENLNKNGINWIKLNWSECNKFIYSCIAARLTFALKGFRPDPVKIMSRVNRADLWKKLYNTSAGKGTPQIYWQKTQDTYTALNIKNPYDGFTYEQAKQKGIKDSFGVPLPQKPIQHPQSIKNDQIAKNDATFVKPNPIKNE